MFENWTLANVMGGMIYADGKLVATVFGHLEKLRPRTYVGWFLATFSLKRYPLVLRYRVHPSRENKTFNAASVSLATDVRPTVKRCRSDLHRTGDLGSR